MKFEYDPVLSPYPQESHAQFILFIWRNSVFSTLPTDHTVSTWTENDVHDTNGFEEILLIGT